MMDYFRDHYGKTYAPNTRETVRRQTVHQFLDAGLIVINPDDSARPTNSDKTVYQIEASALELLRTYGTDEWAINLETYLESRETLREKHAAEREMARIPVTLPDGRAFTLSGGGQNILVKEIIDEFCPRWTPGGVVLYVGDTDDKFAHYDEKARISGRCAMWSRSPASATSPRPQSNCTWRSRRSASRCAPSKRWSARCRRRCCSTPGLRAIRASS